MTKKQLIAWSAARESLDLIFIGQIPGLSQLLDLPILIMHFMYAGPAALFTLLDLIPVVGWLPLFTIAAMGYRNRDEEVHAVAAPRVTARSLPADEEQLYALVNGKLVPVLLPDASEMQSETRVRHVNSIEVNPRQRKLPV